MWEDCEVLEGQTSSVLITADSDCVKIWDIESAKETGSFEAEQIKAEAFQINAVKRDPHNPKLLGTIVDDHVSIFDLRTEARGLSFIAHDDQALDLAFNSNALHLLSTCGTDGTLRFWDMRKSNRCLLQFEDEQQGHWLTKLKYNTFHDQLLLTGSTSTFVHLYRALSVSS